jgi:hypothetical protein
LHEFAEPCGTHAALAMSGSTPLSGRAEAVAAQQSTKSFATERKALALDQLLAEMVIVEAGIGAARQLDDPLAHGVRQTTGAGTAAVGVSQSRCAALPVTGFVALDMPRPEVEQLRGSGSRHVSLDACADDAHSLQLFLTQCECLLSHRVTFSRCR